MPAADTIPSLRSTIDSRARSRQPFRSSIRRTCCNQVMAGLELVYTDLVERSLSILLRGRDHAEPRLAAILVRPGSGGCELHNCRPVDDAAPARLDLLQPVPVSRSRRAQVEERVGGVSDRASSGDDQPTVYAHPPTVRIAVDDEARREPLRPRPPANQDTLPRPRRGQP